MSLEPTFKGEIQLRRWSESSTQGVQVTFALADADDLEPLKAKSGKRFMAVLVEIGDDEMPVQLSKETRGKLCIEACDLCRLPEFQQWVQNVADYAPNESGAADFIRTRCEVSSRKDLDTDAEAAQRFVMRVRIPFMKRKRVPT